MTTWIDATVRLSDDPEIEVNPVTGEFEYTWTVPEIPDGKFTVILPPDMVDRVSARSRELLALLS